ncbi:unnamed protein product [Blepharisma stoltei]|uniref:Histidine kinase n=1 Tax=Blepharisma stoltei TaxID=1481888 RepID=A0AAU9JRT7_9CILI|nr:unnamed protein product [Blepharisma stoltei]
MENLRSSWWEEEVNEKYQVIKNFAYTVLKIILFVIAFNLWCEKNHDMLFTFLPFDLLHILECIALWYGDNKNKAIKSWIIILSSELNSTMWFLMGAFISKETKIILCVLSFASINFFEWPIIESFWIRNFILLKHFFYFYYIEYFTVGLDCSAIEGGFSQMISIFIFLLCELNWRQTREKSFGKFSYRKTIEKAEKRLSLIFELFPDGILIISSDYKILFSNENLIKLLGCSAQQILPLLNSIQYIEGKKYLQWNISNKLIDDANLIQNLQLNDETLLGVCRIGEFNLEWKGQKILWDDEEATLLTVRNVNNLIQLERTLSDSKLKNVILRSVSHELRTPINAISNFVESLKEEPEIACHDEWNSKLDITLISSKLLLSLVNDLLDYSRILAGVFSIKKSKFLLRNAINNTIQLIKIQAERKGLKIISRIDPQLPVYIFSDPLRFNQVLLNLLSNALKFTISGFIEVTCLSCADGTMKTIVQDTGIGIKESKIKDLFQEFHTQYQETLNPTGCGLGLFISNIIAKELGSNSIEVQSKESHGSSFSFIIDIKESIHNGAINNSETLTYDDSLSENLSENIFPIIIKDFNAVMKQEYPKILIVDDNEFNRISLGSILFSNNILYSEACTGKQAVNNIEEMSRKKKPFKLVIMDGSMPELNGWDATKQIFNLHAEGKLDDLPTIIGYTAFTSDQDIKMCIDAGMADCIIKPCSSQILMSKIFEYLK